MSSGVLDFKRLYEAFYGEPFDQVILKRRYPDRDLTDYFKNRSPYLDKIGYETVEEYDKRLFYKNLLNETDKV